MSAQLVGIIYDQTLILSGYLLQIQVSNTTSASNQSNLKKGFIINELHSCRTQIYKSEEYITRLSWVDCFLSLIEGANETSLRAIKSLLIIIECPQIGN